jgi:GST-like protein
VLRFDRSFGGAGTSGKGAARRSQACASAWASRARALDSNGSGQPISIFESGAVLLYLAEKTGRLIPTGLAARWDCVQ